MIKKQLSKQEQATLEKKERIYQIALELFQTYGYDQTTIRQICGAAHITTGSFYHFFHDKLGLVRELYVKLLEEGSPVLTDNPDALDHPFQAIFDYFIRMTAPLEYFRRDVAQQILADASHLMTGPYDAPFDETAKGLLSRFLRQAQDYGSVPANLDIEKTIIYLMAVATGCSQYWILRSRNMTLREAATLILIPAFSAITDEAIVFHE